MKTLVLGNEIFEISESSVLDVKIAKESLNDLLGDWIYRVDPETMDEIKAIYRASKNGSLSLFNVFCRILKLN